MAEKIEYELDNLTREKMRQKKLGVNNPNYGKPRDEVTRQKIARSQQIAWNKRKATGVQKNEDGEGWTHFQFENEIIALMKGIGTHKTIILNEEGFREFLLYLQDEAVKKKEKLY